MATKIPTEKKSFALDIFDILGKLSTGDTQLYDTLTEEEQKGMAPLVLMRWMSGTSDLRQIIMLNELCNPFIFSIGGTHKELMVKLLAVASSKQQHRYQWKGIKKKVSSESTLGLNVLKQFYGYSTREAKEVYHLLSKDDIISLSEQLGYQKDETKKLTKELG